MSTSVMKKNTRSITYGNKIIGYSLTHSNRKTMEIGVYPDCTVKVKVPHDTDIATIENRLKKRSRWILKQLRYFGQFKPKTPPRSYVNGETHSYMGKKYRLKIVAGDENSIKLTRGFFTISCKNIVDPECVIKLINRWYAEKAATQFAKSIDRCLPKLRKFVNGKPTVVIKRMKKRWGSLSEKNTLTLNTDLVKAPKECIDYVVIHELCHLKHRNHDSGFYKLLNTFLPDWERVKDKLEHSLT